MLDVMSVVRMQLNTHLKDRCVQRNMKFKVGDRIRSKYFTTIGREGLIIEKSDTHYCWVIKFDDEKSIERAAYHEDYLELLSPKEGGSMRKRYILLKESPEFEKGAVFEEQCDDGTQDFDCITPDKRKEDVRSSAYYDREVVIDQPDWFQEVEVLWLPSDQIKKVKKILKIK